MEYTLHVGCLPWYHFFVEIAMELGKGHVMCGRARETETQTLRRKLP